MISTLVVDSGPLLAAANRADPDHRACLEALQKPGRRLVIPTLCVAEVAYLLGSRRGSAVEAAFVRGLETFAVEAPRSADWARIAGLVERYADLPLGTVDAAVVVLAERYETDRLLTLDRRHFEAVQAAGGGAFQIEP